MTKQNLVALVFDESSNVLEVSPSEVKYKGFSIDYESMVWRYQHWNLPIGKARSHISSIYSSSRYGIIGVYDADNEEHLESMKQDKEVALKSPSSDKNFSD